MRAVTEPSSASPNDTAREFSEKPAAPPSTLSQSVSSRKVAPPAAGRKPSVGDVGGNPRRRPAADSSADVVTATDKIVSVKINVADIDKESAGGDELFDDIFAMDDDDVDSSPPSVSSTGKVRVVIGTDEQVCF